MKMATRLLGSPVVLECVYLYLSFSLLLKVTAAPSGLCGPQQFDSTCNSAFYKGSPPKGIEKLMWEGRTRSQTKHPTATLCQGGYIASMYDCRLRIPVWSAMSLASQEIQGATVGRCACTFRDNFPTILDIDDQYRQKDRDYDGASKLHKIDKGHLISAKYAGFYVSGNDASQNMAKDRVEASFSYSNVVPQYQLKNRGAWLQCEKKLVKWAKKWIRSESTRLYILVGAVPRVSYLTMQGVHNTERTLFLTDGQLKDQQPRGKGINVPLATWTGMCVVLSAIW